VYSCSSSYLLCVSGHSVNDEPWDGPPALHYHSSHPSARLEANGIARLAGDGQVGTEPSQKEKKKVSSGHDDSTLEEPKDAMAKSNYLGMRLPSEWTLRLFVRLLPDSISIRVCTLQLRALRVSGTDLGPAHLSQSASPVRSTEIEQRGSMMSRAMHGTMLPGIMCVRKPAGFGYLCRSWRAPARRVSACMPAGFLQELLRQQIARSTRCLLAHTTTRAQGARSLLGHGIHARSSSEAHAWAVGWFVPSPRHAITTPITARMRRPARCGCGLVAVAHRQLGKKKKPKKINTVLELMRRAAAAAWQRSFGARDCRWT
jgi:hypothetical protein